MAAGPRRLAVARGSFPNAGVLAAYQSENLHHVAYLHERPPKLCRWRLTPDKRSLSVGFQWF